MISTILRACARLALVLSIFRHARIALLAVFVATLLFAAAAPLEARADDGASYAVSQELTASEVIVAPGTTYPIVWPWGVRLALTATAAASCDFSMGRNVAIGNQYQPNHFTLTDSDTTTVGVGAGVYIPANSSPVYAKALYAELSQRTGARTKLCSTVAAASPGATTRPACYQNSDCTTFGAGSSCGTVSAADMARYGGAILVCRHAHGGSSSVIHAAVSK